MKKYIFGAIIALFLPHFLIWSTVLMSGFSVDYKEIFNSGEFWGTCSFWWIMSGGLLIAVITAPPFGTENKE
jgi:hypothetical protein